MKGIPPTLVRTVISFSFVNLLAVSPLTELFYQKGFRRCQSIRPKD